VPEFIDPVFTKTSPKRSFSLNRKRALWLVFAKTGSIISGTGLLQNLREAVLLPLEIIYNMSMEKGESPEEWRTANVAPIFKKGTKGDPVIIDQSHSPVCLAKSWSPL
jgi:hypothetical protein